MTLEDAVKAQAAEIGFDLAGITTADPFPEADAAYQRWIEAGMHAGMAYMSAHRDRVGDPRRARPGARSIVAVAMNYYAGESAPPQDGELRGRIARYAWGDDYHQVMETRLRALAGFLVARGATLAHYYVDTGPTLDRAIAQRAGLGWCGRHSCLITKSYGTWVVLGEILTDLVLRPDPPAGGDCALCWNCMHGSEACPTGAIVAPGVVDARRCISYWTIEHRGWIPRAVRPALQDMIFGCDLCQEACPFNRLARPTAHPEFRPRPEIGTHPRLLPLLNLSEADYHRLFRRSAVKRAGRSGLRRNVAVALGNLGDERAVPGLIAALADPADPVVRGHAAWALGRIGGRAARDALEAGRRTERDPEVADEIQAALEERWEWPGAART
ncbi:MAG: tRNA epoxyqueuosine(34) reductase QueG [Armatimonadota bacterium]|nr:tRNA epoxyqueuosine(34) reductase QueG [Armatimonadota bacterium]MDR7550411.1 tRNA epoxyqueuosine(34) reductase QueG [Armatimonadota bacterium]